MERIEPLDDNKGFEVRVDSIAENSLSDEVFLREIEKLLVAAGTPPGFARYRLAFATIFLRTLPPGVKLGSWINFRVDTKNQTAAPEGDPDVSGSFNDGITVLEVLEPELSFSTFKMECYFAENNGFLVQTDVKSITK